MIQKSIHQELKTQMITFIEITFLTITLPETTLLKPVQPIKEEFKEVKLRVILLFFYSRLVSYKV